MPKPIPARLGGPNTTAERTITAGNGLKTGAYSSKVVLANEDANLFAELEAQLIQDFDLVGMAQAEAASALSLQAQNMLDAPYSQRKPATVLRKWPELCEKLQCGVEDYEMCLEDLIRGTSPDSELPDLDQALADIVESNQTVIWLWEDRERVAKAIQLAQDSKLLE